jgi:DNA-binding NtrC family response regulator
LAERRPTGTIPAVPTISILVVEDDPALGKAIVELLRGRGADAELAEGFAQARAALNRRRFDRCLADVRLRDGTGQNVASLCAMNRIDCVLMSGDANVVESLRDIGFAILEKPILDEHVAAAFPELSAR